MLRSVHRAWSIIGLIWLCIGLSVSVGGCRGRAIGAPVLCGDGVIDPTEACEGEELLGQSCESLGFSGGSLACGSDCRLVRTGCLEGCGNGRIEAEEPCDDGNAERFDGCGNPCEITEIRVNPWDETFFPGGRAAIDDRGEILVTWVKHGNDRREGIWAQRFAPSGAREGSPIEVLGPQEGISIAPLPPAILGDGRWLVVWNEARGEPYVWTLGSRAFAGDSPGPIERVASNVRAIDLAVTPEGSVRLIWTVTPDDTLEAAALELAGLDETGSLAWVTRVDESPPAPRRLDALRLVGHADGRATAVWMEQPGVALEGGRQVRARSFGADGQAEGPPLTLTEWGSENHNHLTDVVALPDGGLIMTWSSYLPHGTGVARFSSDGLRVGGSFFPETVGSAVWSQIVAVENGYLLAWSEDENDGCLLKLQRLDPDGVAMGEPLSPAFTTFASLVSGFSFTGRPWVGCPTWSLLSAQDRLVMTWWSWSEETEGVPRLEVPAGVYLQRFDAEARPIGALPW